MASVIGTTLLNYQVGEALGSGGLGTVYRGEHALIGRQAALKVLNPEASHDTSMVARFLAEARAVNAIRHPNIVEVTDYGQVGNIYVIVMELLEGETLALRLTNEKQLTEQATLSLLVQVCSAMGAAHERGIIHRDLKPENIFFTQFADYPDFVKVLDFGIAKLSGELKNPNLTTPGLIIGTPSYMSPEQCMGDAGLDERSDIYSLGVVAYRSLAGRLPFEGVNAMQVMQGHLTGQAAPLRSLNASVSVELENMVGRCMAKNPAERFESMLEVRRFVERLGAKMPLAFSAEELAPPQASKMALARQPSAANGCSHDKTYVRTSHVKGPDREEERMRVEAVMMASKMREHIENELRSDRLKLPALPEVAINCLQLAHDPEVKFSALAALIERDPFIASRVMRVANSALYGALPRLTNVEGAVARLGIRSLVGLLQELAAEQVFVSRDPQIRLAFRGIWEHCLGVAHLARDLASTVAGVNPNTAYLAGLFHDIGKPVVASLLLEHERGAKGGAPLAIGRWMRVVEELYRDVGAILALRWFLPREVANAIAHADSYDLKRGRHSSANLVRLANALCGQIGLDTTTHDPVQCERAIVQGKQVLGIRQEQIKRVLDGLKDKVHALTQETEEASGTRTFDRGAM